MWIDSHCHPHLLDEHLQEQVIKTAIAEHIKMLCVSVELSDYEILSKLSKKFCENLFFSIGQHPLHNDYKKGFDWNYIKNILEQEFKNSKESKIVALGETGFDFQGDFKVQRENFEKHVELASDYNLPIILHTRDCEKETKAALIDAKKHFPNLKGVFHCFTGSIDLAEFAIEIGWMISFAGIITFKNAQQLKDVAAYLNKNNLLDNLLIETDSPYLAPVPFRGKTNEPSYVKYIGKFLSDFFGKDETDFASLIKVNFNKLFNTKII